MNINQFGRKSPVKYHRIPAFSINQALKRSEWAELRVQNQKSTGSQGQHLDSTKGENVGNI